MLSHISIFHPSIPSGVGCVDINNRDIWSALCSHVCHVAVDFSREATRIPGEVDILVTSISPPFQLSKPGVGNYDQLSASLYCLGELVFFPSFVAGYSKRVLLGVWGSTLGQSEAFFRHVSGGIMLVFMIDTCGNLERLRCSYRTK